MHLEPGSLRQLGCRSCLDGPLPTRQEVLHKRLILRPDTESLHNGLVQRVHGQLQGIPRVIQLLVQAGEEDQPVAMAICHVMGVHRDAEDMGQGSVGIVFVGLGLGVVRALWWSVR